MYCKAQLLFPYFNSICVVLVEYMLTAGNIQRKPAMAIYFGICKYVSKDDIYTPIG